MDTKKQREYSEKEVLTRRKDLAEGVVLNCIRQEIWNGAWTMAITQCVNNTEFSRELFQDSILL